MIEQQLREIASHINKLQRQEHMFIEELRVLKDVAGPDLSQRLDAVNDRMDAFTVSDEAGIGATCADLPAASRRRARRTKAWRCSNH
jgi:predicted RecB family endonuclease